MSKICAEQLVCGYGSLQVLKGPSVEVAAGELVAVVGANGAGKSTLLRAIQGLTPVWSGRVLLDGVDITRLPAERRVALGLTLVPETKELFPELSVLDNLQLGAYLHRRRWGSAFKTGGSAARDERADLGEVLALFPVLGERLSSRAATLSGGQQQMLAIGRALMTRPSALMLDEPSLGLAPLVVRQIFGVLAALRDRGLAILLVEQNMRAALKLSKRGYVLETGAIAEAGPSEALLERDSVRHAYLGGHVQR